MKCVHPRVVYDGEFASEYPCGKCVACRRSRTREWANRCIHELSFWKESIFLTLTYDDEHYPENGSLSKEDARNFLKRLRKSLEPKLIKYFGCGEYGEKYERPHYHFILFGVSTADKCFKFLRKQGDKNLYSLSAWEKGIIYVGNVNYKSCAYVAGYIQKKLGVSKYVGRIPPFQMQSQGLGKRYALKEAGRLSKDLSFTMNGAKCSLPRYYKKVLEHRLFDYQFNDLKEESVEELDEFCAATGRASVDDRIEYKRAIREQNENELKALDSIKNDRKF